MYMSSEKTNLSTEAITPKIIETIETAIRSPETLVGLPEPYAEVELRGGTLSIKEKPGQPSIFVSKINRAAYEFMPQTEEHRRHLQQLCNFLHLDNIDEVYAPVPVDLLEKLGMPNYTESVPLIHVLEGLRSDYVLHQYEAAVLSKAIELLQDAPEFLRPHEETIITMDPDLAPRSGAFYWGKFGSRHFIGIHMAQRRLSLADLSLATKHAQDELDDMVHELIHQAHAEISGPAFFNFNYKEVYGESEFDSLSPEAAIELAIDLENKYAQLHADAITNRGSLENAVVEGIAFIGSELLRGGSSGTINGGSDVYNWATRCIVTSLREQYQNIPNGFAILVERLMKLDLDKIRELDRDSSLVENVVKDASQLFVLVA